MHGDKFELYNYSKDKCRGKYETLYSGQQYLAKFAYPYIGGEGGQYHAYIFGTKNFLDQKFCCDFFLVSVLAFQIFFMIN